MDKRCRKNALFNARNPFQGNSERVLVLCSAGLLRSPTVAGELYLLGYNSRSAGVHDYALIQVDEVLLEWADTVLFVQGGLVGAVDESLLADKRVVCLNIEDDYDYRSDELVALVRQQLANNGFVPKNIHKG